MEREEVTAALAGLKRIGASKKAAIIERALVVAREARLWEGAADETAARVLEELSVRFYAVGDEPLRARLEVASCSAVNGFWMNESVGSSV